MHVMRKTLARASRSDADEEHRAIMQTTIDRNASEAARLLRLHFEKTAELVREVGNVARRGLGQAQTRERSAGKHGEGRRSSIGGMAGD